MFSTIRIYTIEETCKEINKIAVHRIFGTKRIIYSTILRHYYCSEINNLMHTLHGVMQELF